ncbi:MAG TPA: hypothetical protein VHW71_00450 [Steroidobacteraceae bacterium]|nr:hypothetical protein [Steroidobacteraceae bacterium]
MRILLAWVALAALAPGSRAADPAVAARVEARSSDLLAVGMVHGDTMSVRVSRLIDNAPVKDAAISVVLRGTSHAATAETDGSYSVQTKDLALPGAAAVDFRVSQGAAVENLKGTLDVAGSAGGSDDRNGNRQVWWWVLNFAVCGAALWLFSRRRKAAKTKEPV